jgi:hypothetical protein
MPIANIDAQKHYDISRQLKELREEDVLIIGSGNIVHNLRMARFDDFAYGWRWTLINVSPSGSRKTITNRSFIMKKAIKPQCCACTLTQVFLIL